MWGVSRETCMGTADPLGTSRAWAGRTRPRSRSNYERAGLSDLSLTGGGPSQVKPFHSSAPCIFSLMLLHYLDIQKITWNRLSILFISSLCGTDFSYWIAFDIESTLWSFRLGTDRVWKLFNGPSRTRFRLDRLKFMWPDRTDQIVPVQVSNVGHVTSLHMLTIIMNFYPLSNARLFHRAYSLRI